MCLFQAICQNPGTVVRSDGEFQNSNRCAAKEKGPGPVSLYLVQGPDKEWPTQPFRFRRPTPVPVRDYPVSFLL